MDWLLTGEGEMRRGQAAPDAAVATPDVAVATPDVAPRSDATIYNDMKRKPISIGDLLAKTATVLESETVYRDALHSNIEAFYHSVMLEQKIDDMQANITSRLDAIEAENAQLRLELEQSRAESAVRDTG